jgi:hypothetical protein
MNVFAVTRDLTLPLILMIGFGSCWLVAMIGFVKAYSNLQPGVKWWSLWISNEREVLERTFTPRGLFWLKVAQYAIIAAFIIFALVNIAARL